MQDIACHANINSNNTHKNKSLCVSVFGIPVFEIFLKKEGVIAMAIPVKNNMTSLKQSPKHKASREPGYRV